MKHEIRVPAVSEGVTEGTVVSISVGVGDSVEVEQTLLELETDKAVVEVPSNHAGKITEVLVAEGDRVAIDAVINSHSHEFVLLFLFLMTTPEK